MSAKINFFFLLSIIVIARCELGAQTFCGNIFFEDGPKINSMENAILAKCKEVAALGAPNGEGCLVCNRRNVNGLYPFESKVDVMSICMGSTVTCQTKYNGNMENLFNQFFNQVNTQEKMRNVTENEKAVLYRTSIEKDIAPDSSKIQIKEIKHTKTSFTYEITSNLDYPIKCYKALDTKQHNFIESDLYYILKPNTQNRVFTEYFPESDYDCKKYSLYLECYSIPFQDNAEKVTKVNFGTFLHKDKDSQCEYIDLDEENEKKEEEEKKNQKPAQELPKLDGIDPLEDFSNELLEFEQNDEQAKKDEVTKINKNLQEEINTSSTIVGKVNVVVKANQKIQKVDCKEDSSCQEAKSEIVTETWNQIEMLAKTSEDLSDSLGKEGESFEENTKIFLEALIISYNNYDSFSNETLSKSIALGTKALESSSDILKSIDSNTHIQDKSTVKKDVISLFTAAASSSLYTLNPNLVNKSSKKNIIRVTDEAKSLYSSFNKLAEILIENEKEVETENYSFNYIVLAKALRRLETINDEAKENEKAEEGEYVFLREGVEIKLPVSYIQKEYNNEDTVHIGIFTYASYPFFEEKGAKDFSNLVVSVNLLSGNEVIQTKTFPEEEKIEVKYNVNSLEKDYNGCYIVNPTSSESIKKISRVSEKGSIVCRSDKFGDVMVGDPKNGIQGWGIFLIILSVFIVLGILGFIFYWLYSRSKKDSANEFRQAIELNNTN